MNSEVSTPAGEESFAACSKLASKTVPKFAKAKLLKAPLSKCAKTTFS